MVAAKTRERDLKICSRNQKPETMRLLPKAQAERQRKHPLSITGRLKGSLNRVFTGRQRPLTRLCESARSVQNPWQSDFPKGNQKCVPIFENVVHHRVHGGVGRLESASKFASFLNFCFSIWPSVATVTCPSTVIPQI